MFRAGGANTIVRMKTRRSCCERPLHATEDRAAVARSLWMLAAIDLAAFAAAAWLCVSVPESLAPWTRTVEAAGTASIDSSARACP